jgi:Photoprotection regulator fluorescence recovery protein
MPDLSWSNAEKALSRKLFEQALDAELAETLAEFKAKAAMAGKPEEMWAIHDYLGGRRRDIDAKYDYRYSQLIFVFGALLRESRIREPQLAGLSQDKQAMIKRIASL